MTIVPVQSFNWSKVFLWNYRDFRYAERIVSKYPANGDGMITAKQFLTRRVKSICTQYNVNIL